MSVASPQRGDVFPDRDADPDLPSSYDFTDLDRAIESVRRTGAEPLWAAQYDVGRDSNRWAPNGNQAGLPPRDPARWARVAVRVLAHLNDGWAEGHEWGIRYLEFINEPTGLGGYEANEAGFRRVAEHFVVLVRAVAEYARRTGRDAKVVGPSLTGGDTARALSGFLGELARAGVPADRWILSYHDYALPEEMAERARRVKRTLAESAGGSCRDVPVWNTEWNWPIHVQPPEELRRSLDENGRSAWTMAHNAQVKTLVQGLWDEATVYRASRGAVREKRRRPAEFFWFHLDDGTGRPRPAYFEWLLFDRIAREAPRRLRARSAGETPTVLAGRDAESRRLHVLLSHWRALPLGSNEVRYELVIRGLPPGARFEVSRGTVDRTSESLEAAETRAATADDRGELVLSGTMALWSLEAWRIERP